MYPDTRTFVGKPPPPAGTPVALGDLFANVTRELEDYRPARESLYDFVRVTKPDMLLNWFHKELADTLQQFYEDVIEGLQPRLMIFAPPRIGKSEMGSRRFPAWCFGKSPRLNMIACSYAADLASRMNRDVQRIMDGDAYHSIFPDTRLGGENIATVSGKPLRNSKVFEIVDHLGAYRSAGVQGGITGQGFDIGLIDDPVADAASANSEVTRQSIWEWYQTTFYTRQSPLAGIVLIMTRWHQDDLAGRLLEAQTQGGEKWQVVSFPAIAEVDEAHRKIGEAIQPERYDEARYKAIEGVSGSYAWACMYQQRPGPKGGTIFKRKHWNFWTVLPEFDEVIMSVDCTFKDLVDNDYVAIQVWGRKGANKYLIKRTKEQMGFSATVMAIRSTRAQMTRCDAILIEDKANGSAVIDTLTTSISGMIPVNPEGGKVARAFAIQPDQEAGNLFLPDPSIDSDIETFLGEVSSFPSVTHDDETDAMTQAVNWYKNREGAYGMLEFAKRQVEAQTNKRKAA